MFFMRKCSDNKWNKTAKDFCVCVTETPQRKYLPLQLLIRLVMTWCVLFLHKWNTNIYSRSAKNSKTSLKSSKSLKNIPYKGSSMSVSQHSQLKHSCTKRLSEVQRSLKSLSHILFIYSRWLYLHALFPPGLKSVQTRGSLHPTTVTDLVTTTVLSSL